MTLMDGLELYICVILTIEFVYDYWYNSRDNRIKRRQNAKKSKDLKEKEMDKQGFRERTGGVVQETKGQMCDMRETPIPVQKETQS